MLTEMTNEEFMEWMAFYKIQNEDSEKINNRNENENKTDKALEKAKRGGFK